jgi:6-phosphogluconolactonase
MSVAAHASADRIRIHPDTDALAHTVSHACLGLAGRCIRERGAFHVALAGGRTPEALYRRLAAAPPGAADWTRWQVYYGDERCVPQDHPDSNHRMVSRAWLDHVAIPREHIHPMVSDPDDPDADARAYTHTLAPLNGQDGVPILDLVLLGVGIDGHTASLFPGTDILQIADRPVAAVRHPGDGTWRVSLTRPVPARARALWFLVTGRAKAGVVRRVLHPATPGDRALPAALCNRDDAVWHLDREAAAELLP